MKPALLLTALVIAAPAAAADRVVTVTTFDKLRVEGPYRVEIVTGRGPSARISGAREAIDRVSVKATGKTLVIRPMRNSWTGGWPDERMAGPVVIRLTTGEPVAVALSGSGSIALDRARGARVDLSATGSGEITVGAVDADRLNLSASGGARMRLAGRARSLDVAVRGAASIDGRGLVANDLVLFTSSAGEVALGARNSARVNASGSGATAIAGKPACKVEAQGSGTVACGG